MTTELRCCSINTFSSNLKRLIQEQKEQKHKDRANRPYSAGGRHKGNGLAERGRERVHFPRPRWIAEGVQQEIVS